MVEEIVDPRRSEPPYGLGEREMLEAWLEFHRTTLLLKVEGLDDAQRKARPVASSLLSLHGLVRHMADVERLWFHKVLLREDVPYAFTVNPGEDTDLHPIDDADWEADLAEWQAECERSRRTAARFGLDDAGERDGRPCTLRCCRRRQQRARRRARPPAPRSRGLSLCLAEAPGWLSLPCRWSSRRARLRTRPWRLGVCPSARLYARRHRARESGHRDGRA